MVSKSNIVVFQELNLETLGKLQEVLERIGQKLYTSVNPKGNASIGQHVRHTLEFYQCLFKADDVVNYDQRKRDILIESSFEHAMVVLGEIKDCLQRDAEERELALETEVSVNDDLTIQVPSSYSRELFYVLEHAIHHMALIRVLIKDQQPDFELAEGFGVAYSTLAYRNQAANG